MTGISTSKKISALGAALLCAALLSGCASTTDVNKAQATADAASQKADQASATAAAGINTARSEAAAASSKADQALALAGQSKTTADAAKAVADQALQEVRQLAEKIDRMFKKTMQK